MCGMLGIWNKNKDPEIQKIVSRHSPLICKLHERRGPDQTSAVSVNDFYLFFNRLKITGDDVNGQQPIFSEDSVLLFNGEIYNYKEFNNQARSDSILLNSLRQKGRFNFPYNQLRGQFAICDISLIKDELVLARDYFGEKPLYYFEDTNILVFSSSLTGIRSMLELIEKPITIDINQIPTFLATGFIADNSSLFEQIRQVEKGYQIKFFRNDKNQKIDWASSVELSKNNILKPSSNLANEFMAILKEVVREQTDNVVNPAISFSGGVDSSVLAIAAKEIGLKVRAFTVGFEVEQFDESVYAMKTANQIGIPISVHKMTGDDAKNEFQKILEFGMDPLGDPSSLPTRFLSSIIAQDTKVVLGGDGSDELFFGYHRMHQLLAVKKTPFKFELNRSMILRLRNLHRIRKIDYNLLYLNMLGQPKYAEELTGVSTQIIAEKMSKEIGKLDGQAESLRNFEINGYLPSNILIKGDRSAMEYSLELRNPFLDPRILKFAFTNDVLIGSNEKKNKYFLREIMKKSVSEENHSRPKRGFTPPLENWLRKELYYESKKLLQEADFSNVGINKNLVISLFDDFIEKKRDVPVFTIWAILMFALQIQN